MDIYDHSQPEKSIRHVRSIAGVLLILTGGLLFLDQYLRTGWLSMLVLPGVGLFLYLWGIRLHHYLLLIIGGAMAGAGTGLATALNPMITQPGFLTQLGNLMLFFAVGWFLVVIGSVLFTAKQAWWALIPAGVSGALSACIFMTSFTWTDIILYLSLGLGLPLLGWGLVSRLFGLIIPGCLLIGAGPGIYMAWGADQPANGLVQTGVMLVWFSLGWALITLFSRMRYHRFAWWPLIPGGIMAMVGCGLYIGGDPDNALGFISNTGSIGLMIFGLYLLLMRKGIHR